MKQAQLLLVGFALIASAAFGQSASWSATGPDRYQLSLDLSGGPYRFTNAEMVVTPSSGTIVVSPTTADHYNFAGGPAADTWVSAPIGREAFLDGAGAAYADGGTQNQATPNASRPSYDGVFTATKVSVAWFDADIASVVDMAGPHTVAQVTLSAGGVAPVSGTLYVYDVTNDTIVELPLDATLGQLSDGVVDLGVSVAGSSGAVRNGELYWVELTVENIDVADDAAAVEVTLPSPGSLPTELAFVQAVASEPVSSAGGVVTWDVGTLAAGSSTTARFEFATSGVVRFDLPIEVTSTSANAGDDGLTLTNQLISYVGDANLDGSVNAADFSSISASAQSMSSDANYDASTDFDSDGDVDIDDFSRLIANFGLSVP